MCAQRQVGAQSDQGTFGVVTDGGVGGVLVDSVIFHPRIKTGLRHTLDVTTGRCCNLVDCLGYQVQVALGFNETCPLQKQVVVIAGETLEKPQQLGVVLSGEVNRRQFSRTKTLHVPRVEILVAYQTQQLPVALTRFRRSRVCGW